ncbi:MAG: RNA polymerase factor sigma-32 [Oceanicaulis sp.]|uniref:RNA polymerase factor sigma-32 n=1 Tax=unclassified Oceanicaulis TaxID=2632123 RepID=UPI000066A163|nr:MULTISPECIES: RNA polymerase factor sigma-32 [unclassified Oceanicaulis]EAP89934.1 RNA polymerase sigma factor [Oceanicaulis sp. HTCC2633]MBC37574.1 RNA polymerase factor sigma-32 [Oceanicaulis sp.]MBG35956.1 RNA polymerase factor sigma-32 [Oceanicaulis sp.]
MSHSAQTRSAPARSADPDRRFMKQAMDAPLLEREEELNLATAWKEKGDEEALHALTTAYMRLVISIAAKFRHYGLPFPDLVSEGNIGLMQAAARFEPEREVRFSTYATWWIRASIQDYVLRNWSIVRTGTTAAQKSLFFNLRRLRALIKDTSSGQLTPENRAYVAQALRVGEDDVEKMASRLAAVDRSLNAPFSEDGEGEWQDLLADENPDPETQVMEDRDQAQRAQWLGEALSRLSEREQLIIRERRLGEDSVTLEKLGERLGISKERVRQVEHQALNKLKKYLTEVVGDPEEAGLLPTS